MSEAVALPMMLAGTAMDAGGTILGANAEAGVLKRQADQYEVIAKQRRASSQRKAVEEIREGELQQSRVQALTAASGAGASDPSVVDALARMAGKTQYAKDVALYEGETDARSYEEDARSRRQEARNVKAAGRLKAVGKILKTGMSMYDRYGGGSSSSSSGSSVARASSNSIQWMEKG